MAMRDRAPFVDYYRLHIPNLEVVWDTTSNATETWKATMRHIGPDPAIVIEDDVVLTRGFCAKVEAAVAAHSTHPVQLHSRTKDDVSTGSRWRSGMSFYNNQCFYYPPGLRAVDNDGFRPYLLLSVHCPGCSGFPVVGRTDPEHPLSTEEQAYAIMRARNHGLWSWPSR